jgi:hypothetical protein
VSFLYLTVFYCIYLKFIFVTLKKEFIQLQYLQTHLQASLYSKKRCSAVHKKVLNQNPRMVVRRKLNERHSGLNGLKLGFEILFSISLTVGRMSNLLF